MLIKTSVPAPILNRKDFSFVFGNYPQGLLLDEKGLLKPLEMIAFENEIFTVRKEHHDLGQIIYEIFIPNDFSSSFFIDKRFTTSISHYQKRKIEKKSLDAIVSFLEERVGTPYVWGGNFYQGISQMERFYPSQRKLTYHEKVNWKMEGLDCSGLLYQAMDGGLPRNTRDLLFFGKNLDVENKSINYIKDKLMPLDLILWKGHVVIVLDDKRVIESRAHRGGVFITDLLTRLAQILEEEKKTFVSSSSLDETKCSIVRWYH